LYRSAMDPRSCVLRAGAVGPEINSECGIVHAHVCAASPWVVRTLVSVGRRDDGAEKKRMFVERFGCR